MPLLKKVFELIRVPLGVLFALVAMVRMYFVFFPAHPAEILSEPINPPEPTHAWVFVFAICLVAALLLIPNRWVVKYKLLIAAFLAAFGVLFLASAYIHFTSGHFLPEAGLSLIGLTLSLARYAESRTSHRFF